MNHKLFRIVIFFTVFIVSFSSVAFADFEERNGDANPFNQINNNLFTTLTQNNFFASPALGNILVDSDSPEAVIGYSEDSTLLVGTIIFLKLSGGQYSIETTDMTISPSNVFGEGIYIKPTLYDWDNDDDLDLFVGAGSSDASGVVYFYENDGTGKFTREDTLNPFKNISNLGFCKVTFLAESGPAPALAGSSESDGINYYTLNGNFLEPNSNNPASSFSRYNGQPKPFAFKYVSETEFDGLLIGTLAGQIQLYSKNGSDFQSIDNDYVGRAMSYSDPVIPIMDFDGDSNMDIFSGTYDEGILYFEEIGSTPGDYDGDTDVDLDDAILALQILAGLPLDGVTIEAGNEVSGDDAIGVEEAIYALRKVAFP